jgi:hypothetical protein
VSLLRRLLLHFALAVFAVNAFAAPFSAYVLEANEAIEHAAEIRSHKSGAPASQTDPHGAACHHVCGAHLLSHLQGCAATASVLPAPAPRSPGSTLYSAYVESVFLKLPERPPRAFLIG